MTRPTRQAGVLLHPTSLPSRFGVGDLGPAADAFLNWASQAGLRLWQVLPPGPTGPHHSPYDGLSAFAGDPLLVSPEWLVEEGLLPAGALDGAPEFPEGRVDWERVVPFRRRLLEDSFRHAKSLGGRILDEVARFAEAASNAAWLADWSLFAALQGKARGAALDGMGSRARQPRGGRPRRGARRARETRSRFTRTRSSSSSGNGSA